MENLLHIIKLILSSVKPLFRFKTSRKQSRTERIITLIKISNELKNSEMSIFLEDEFFKKVSAELNDVELTKSQITIVKKLMKDSNGYLNWSDFSNAQQYLIVSDTQVKPNYSKADKAFHYTFTGIALLLLIIAIIVLSIHSFFPFHDNKKSIVLFATAFILILFGGCILWNTSSFFSVLKIQRILNQISNNNSN